MMKFTKSLYFQIISLFVLITVFSGAVISIVNNIECKKIVIKQFERSFLTVSDVISSTILDKAIRTKEIILKIATSDAIKSQDPVKIQKFLDMILDYASLLRNIYYYDKDGNLISVSYSDKRDIKQYEGENYHNYANQEKTKNIYTSILKSKATNTPMLSEMFLSQSGKIMYSFIFPLKISETESTVLSCGVHINDARIESLLLKLKPHEGGFAELVDIKDPRYSQYFSSPEFQNKIINRTDHFLAVKPIITTNLGVVIGIQHSVLNELLKTLRMKIWIYGTITLLIAIIISLHFAHRLISPITKIVEGLKLVKQGIYSTKLESTSSGELQDAVEAYNEMTEKLNKNQMMEKIWLDMWNA